MKNNYSNTSALILAAGLSQRMGSPKALLKFNETEIFLTQIINQFLNSGVSNIVVVVNKEVHELLQKKHPDIFQKCKICINPEPEKGRNISIKKGIAEITTDYCFIHNVDNPFVDEKIVNILLHQKENADVIIPCYEGKGGHPVLINRKVMYAIHAMPQHLSFRDFLMQFKPMRIETNVKYILVNISTPEDYKRYF
ncbi:MAG: hypothetical protein A2275_12260 [Bacteroidetes bacterium RIFOXYA12_FULL_35_11]|nr:MAG: hypothetical protein A2X01_01475 [Bacteroidetes bacterium GWF2_35_48]OFY77748.1 MAG: hypothetical protein A2275_12260 [Bacteroidetes bacterium RIFOXYA12_FULL_35_11]OFY92622.1 MAG: hypothetical protein A2491_05305 [Bacteroidetes bacterium RIFOXYC12_FULL_35_7]OFY96583.1 MAG: hypothetical protein A2309_13900 [Bacteroidetes bacterium RIFOXYB2_FULL_35_7]HBX51903.1 hypothetical protein [Bacteroidales bacterium]